MLIPCCTFFVYFIEFVFKPLSSPVQLDGPARSKSVPIPVPTQIQNYQRMRQNLEPAGVHGSTRHVHTQAFSEITVVRFLMLVGVPQGDAVLHSGKQRNA